MHGICVVTVLQGEAVGLKWPPTGSFLTCLCAFYVEDYGEDEKAAEAISGSVSQKPFTSTLSQGLEDGDSVCFLNFVVSLKVFCCLLIC